MTDKDSEVLQYGYYVVAFMDLLGQREAMRKFKGLPDESNKEQIAEFIAFMKDTVGVINHFHKAFQDYFDHYMQARSKFWDESVFFSNNIKFQRYSDGMMIFMPLHAPKGRPPIDGVFGVLGACASIFLLFLSVGRPMRGGIEIGTGVELNKDELTGPAVAEAYELESQIAQYPRIVAGKELVNYIRLHCKPKGSDPVSLIDAETAKICLELLTEDSDRCVIVDFLGKGFRENIAKEIIKQEPFEAYRYVQQQIDEWCREEKNDKLCDRYKRLCRYMDARLPLWANVGT